MCPYTYKPNILPLNNKKGWSGDEQVITALLGSKMQRA